MELKEQILKALGLSSEVKFEVQAKLVDGTIIVSTADALAEGVDISVLTEDGTTIELPIGEFETEDGLTFVVEEAGIIGNAIGALVVQKKGAMTSLPSREDLETFLQKEKIPIKLKQK